MIRKTLISKMPANYRSEYYDVDTKKLYKKNLKVMPDDWIYRNKKIIYNHNEHGFRTRSFDRVDWANSIVMIGCSHTYGLALAEEDTIAAQLEYMTNIPVVNLGQPASAVDLHSWNSLILHDYYPRPRAVVHIWSSLSRYTDISYIDGSIRSYLNFNKDYDIHLNWNERSKYYIRSTRALWQNKVPLVEGTFFGSLNKGTNQDSNILFFKYLDYARDRNFREGAPGHPGIESAQVAAEKIAESLKAQGI